jgi:hypothetical protein
MILNFSASDWQSIPTPSRAIRRHSPDHRSEKAARFKGAPVIEATFAMEGYVLHLLIIKAEDIPNMDFFGKSDPYVLFQLSSSRQLFRTATIDNTDAPVWNECFHITISNPETDILHLIIKDSDDISADDPISKLEIPLSSIRIGEVVEKDFFPIPYPKVPKGGRLWLKLQIAKAGADPFVEPKTAPSDRREPYLHGLEL